MHSCVSAGINLRIWAEFRSAIPHSSSTCALFGPMWYLEQIEIGSTVPGYTPLCLYWCYRSWHARYRVRQVRVRLRSQRLPLRTRLHPFTHILLQACWFIGPPGCLLENVWDYGLSQYRGLINCICCIRQQTTPSHDGHVSANYLLVGREGAIVSRMSGWSYDVVVHYHLVASRADAGSTDFKFLVLETCAIGLWLRLYRKI